MQKKIKVIFIVNNKEIEVEAPIGLSILEAARYNEEIELEGACEGCLACATCHVIVEENFFNKLPEAKEEEEDMLDLAFGLSSTSRLGCQIILNEDLDGIKVRIPSATRNIH